MDNCIFCKIAKEGSKHKILEDDKHLAFLDINPIAKGHTLVIPKAHTDHLFDMENDVYSELWIFTKKVAYILKTKLSVKRIGVIVEGFLVPHAHIHLIPANTGADMSSANRKTATLEELDTVRKNLLGR
jgi:histidine triad (HIT) family protein